MIISGYDIKPISIYLPDEQKWVDRHARAVEYFSEHGIKDVLWLCGIHAENFGVKASRPYARDPQNIETGWTIEPRTVGNFLSWYMAWNVMIHKPEIKYWLIVEDDLLLNNDWMTRAEQALQDVPKDFDYLMLSHCCARGRPTTHVKGEIYEVKYPQAGHVAVLASKALQKIIDKCRDACVPMDVNLFDFVLPELKTYTLLPRLANQVDTFMPA